MALYVACNRCESQGPTLLVMREFHGKPSVDRAVRLWNDRKVPA